jgi:CRP/FNR family transcriptional regulator, dissimilatory nitrate respiration regulator
MKRLLTVAPALAFLPDSLLELGVLTEHNSGAILGRAGSIPRFMHVVLTGQAQLTRPSADGGTAILQRVRSGFLAEASLTSKRYHCDLVCIEPTSIVQFPVKDFRESLLSDPRFQIAWIEHLCGELKKSRSQCERLSLRGARARILHYVRSEDLRSLKELKQSKKAWAAELGLSHEALYRELAKLKMEGRLS